MASSELTELETALLQIIDIFNKYSIRVEDKTFLTPGECKKLVHQQLPHFMKNMGDLDEKMRSLDVKEDNQVEFEEFLQLLLDVGMMDIDK